LSEIPVLTFGVFSDTHQQQVDDGAYNEYSDDKLFIAANQWEVEKVDFVIGLGDIIDSTISEADDLLNLGEIEVALSNYTGDKYLVVGNHDTEEMDLATFITNSQYTTASYKSFDVNGFHCVLLNGYDAGNYFEMSATQIDWLETDLASSSLPKLIFIHYRVDQDYPGDPAIYFGETPMSPFCFSANEIRAKIEAGGNVIAVFQGHHHINAYAKVNDIEYFTFTRMTDPIINNNAYATVSIFKDNTVKVEGFGRQLNY